jgi:hypothetical protein
MTPVDFGYYIRTMITMAVIAYSFEMGSIPAQVDSLGWSVVWGPAELVDDLGVSYSRAYIAQRNDAEGEYAVVIRGTNPISWTSWTQEDFDIGTTVPFDTLLPDSLASRVPDDARISQGTFNGMSDLIALQDPRSAKTMEQFLLANAPRTLYVAGHSLGGTLTPPMYAYLHEVLRGRVGVMRPLSFAGPTAGDSAFNTYLSGTIEPGWRWRVHNTLDIAPALWWSLPGVDSIYAPYNLRWGTLEADWVRDKFNQADGLGYAQPADGGVPLAGVFCPTFLDAHLWAEQVMHQHHGSTYEAMIYLAYPDSSGTTRPLCGVQP